MRQRQRRRPPKIASSSNHWKNIIAFWMLTMTEAIDVLFHITTTPRVRLLGTSSTSWWRVDDEGEVTDQAGSIRVLQQVLRLHSNYNDDHSHGCLPWRPLSVDDLAPPHINESVLTVLRYCTHRRVSNLSRAITLSTNEKCKVFAETPVEQCHRCNTNLWCTSTRPISIYKRSAHVADVRAVEKKGANFRMKRAVSSAFGVVKSITARGSIKMPNRPITTRNNPQAGQQESKNHWRYERIQAEDSSQHNKSNTPIEIVWANVEGEVGRQYSTITTFTDIKFRLQRVFENVFINFSARIDAANKQLTELKKHLEAMDSCEESSSDSENRFD
ncbi:hypothetical protein GN958_ATG17755 [Phytophthora infestans]|uniref:Uncharacterized protein n=1 Tax=Phytophthora infestans TaxID=4787 RepID=A0A8S9U1H2_PHYIN|nr:hypothetical protein GN958_ATG17755 [Phytophthora infestans]